MTDNTKYKVVMIDKRTYEKTLLEGNLTHIKAERICEEWGWNYCDEYGATYWLAILEDKEVTENE